MKNSMRVFFTIAIGSLLGCHVPKNSIKKFESDKAETKMYSNIEFESQQAT